MTNHGRFCAFFSALLVAALAMPTYAVPINGAGVPSVQFDTTLTPPDEDFYALISGINGSINQPLSSTPIDFDVIFPGTRYLEIFDTDLGDFGGQEDGFESVGMEIDIENTSADTQGTLHIEFNFLDALGNIVTPPALASDTFGNNIDFTVDPATGLVGFGRLFRAELMNGLQFHGIRVSLTGDSFLLWKTLSQVEFRKLDTTSNVGGVPEPTAAILAITATLACFLLGRPKR